MDKQNKSEKITTIPELAVLINSGFQTAKEHADEKFAKIDDRFDKVEKSAKETKEKLNEVDIKLTNFIDDYDSDKLPMRVEYIENVLNLPKK